MIYRYRTNLKKVFLTDSELHQLNERIAKSHCQNFSVYARKVLLNPNMSFVTINTDTYDQLVFELRRIGNNINQIARAINQSHLIFQKETSQKHAAICCHQLKTVPYVPYIYPGLLQWQFLVPDAL